MFAHSSKSLLGVPYLRCLGRVRWQSHGTCVSEQLADRLEYNKSGGRGSHRTEGDTGETSLQQSGLTF